MYKSDELGALDYVMIEGYNEFAVGICKEAAEIVNGLRRMGVTNNYETKSCTTDLVTVADKRVETFMLEKIKLTYPHHSFIGEESDIKKSKLDDTIFTWILDPIDGTTNFVHCFPFHAISLGAVYKGKIVIGIVLNLFNNDLYTSIVGRGAYKNGKKLKVSNIDSKNEALIITEFGVHQDYDSSKLKFDTIQSIFTETGSIHGVRSLGCASLNLCMVAEGKADAYYEWGIHCWDIAAGALIVTESGGSTYQYNGEKFDLMSRTILAVSQLPLKDQLISYMPKIETIPRDDE